MGKSLVFTTKCLGSFARFDPESSSLKMLQRSFDWGDMTYLEPLPAQGMMQNGVLYKQEKILIYPTSDDGGFVLPTPLASDAAKHGTGSLHRVLITGQRYSKGDKRLILPTPLASDIKRAKICPSDFKAQDRGFVMGLPATLLKAVTEQNPDPVLCQRLNMTQTEAIKHGARLNPLFVEAMMGFPLDWTKPQSENTTKD